MKMKQFLRRTISFSSRESARASSDTRALVGGSSELRRVPPDDKPVFVPRLREVAAIPLDRPLLDGSSNLPGSRNGAGRSCSPIWSCSAWGFACQPHYCGRGALLPHLFTLTAAVARHGGTFSVPLSVESALSESPRPLAGMLPYGDRTFLPRADRDQARAAACPAEPGTSMTGYLRQEYYDFDVVRFARFANLTKFAAFVSARRT